MPTERGSNGATTSINQSGGITSSATSVTVAASTSAGFPNLTATPGQFRVQVEQELWLVTATSGTDGVNWTITRHIEGTTAAAHVNGSQVVQKLTWAALENLAASGGTPAASAVTFTPAGGIAATDVQAALQEVDTEKAPKASPTFTGVVTTPALAVSGLTGSLSASRYVGATASGAPVSGTFAIGDYVIARNGHVWICTTAGTPGTWTDAGGGGGGSMSSFTLAGDGGSSQTINDGNTLTVAGGVGLVSAAGATDTVTLDLDINSLTADASPDGAADYVATWDASASAHKKVLLNNLPGGGGGTYVGAHAYNTGNQAITTGTHTPLTFDSERHDSDAFHSTSSNTSRLTVPSGKDGKYTAIGNARFAGSSAGTVRLLTWRLNGTTFLAASSVAVSATTSNTIDVQAVLPDYDLVATDYLELCAYHDVGSNLNVLAVGNFSPEAVIRKVG